MDGGRTVRSPIVRDERLVIIGGIVSRVAAGLLAAGTVLSWRTVGENIAMRRGTRTNTAEVVVGQLWTVDFGDR